MFKFPEIFQRKNKQFGDRAKQGHTFSDEDRQKATMAKQLKALEKAELDSLQERIARLKAKKEKMNLYERLNSLEEEISEYEDEDDEQEEEADNLSFEERIGLKFAEQIFSGGDNKVNPLPNFPTVAAVNEEMPPPPPIKSKLNEEEIRGVLEHLPFSAKAYIKHCDTPTLARMIELIKEGK